MLSDDIASHLLARVFAAERSLRLVVKQELARQAATLEGDQMNSVNCFMVSPVDLDGRSVAELGTCVAGCRISASNLIGFRIRGLSIACVDPLEVPGALRLG